MCVFCVYTHTLECGAHGGQKRVWGAPELELLAVVGCHVGASDPTRVLRKSNTRALDHRASAAAQPEDALKDTFSKLDCYHLRPGVGLSPVTSETVRF